MILGINSYKTVNIFTLINEIYWILAIEAVIEKSNAGNDKDPNLILTHTAQ